MGISLYLGPFGLHLSTEDGFDTHFSPRIWVFGVAFGVRDA